MRYYIEEAGVFKGIQPYEVGGYLGRGVTVYHDDLVTPVTDLEDEDITPELSSGTVISEGVTNVQL